MASPDGRQGQDDGINHRKVAVAVDYSVAYKPVTIRREQPLYPAATMPVHDPSHFLLRAKQAVAKSLDRKYQASLLKDGAACRRRAPRRDLEAEGGTLEGGGGDAEAMVDAIARYRAKQPHLGAWCWLRRAPNMSVEPSRRGCWVCV